MKKTSLAIQVLLLCCLYATVAFAQKSTQANGDVNPAFARAEQLFALADSKDAGAFTKIKQALSDENWYVRGEAAIAIARLGDKSNGPLLLPLLQDQNWFVRSAAMRAITLLGAQSETSLVEPGTTDSYVRASALSTAAASSNVPIDSLIKLLADNDDLVRRAAAISLGRAKAPAAIDNLVTLLKDEDPGVRKASAVALGQIADKRVAGALLASIQDPATMDWEYAAALYRLGNRDYFDRITSSLRSEYRDVRQESLKTLLEFADNAALPALLSLSTLDTPWAKKDASQIRVLLAEGLSKFDGDEPRTALINYMDDPEPAVRAAAAMSILKISRTDAKSDSSQKLLITLVSALKKESSPIVIDAISEALVPFDRTRVTDLLLDARNTDGKLPANVLKALAASGVTADSQATQLSSGEVADRVRAAERLARLGDTKAVEPLMDALTNARDLQVRVKSAEALGSLRDRRAVDALVTATRSSEPQIRAAAVTALGMIADHTAADTLFASTRDSEPPVREAAVRSLSALGISVEKVASDLSSPNWQVRSAAVTTFARLGDPSAVPSIINALKDSDSRVRSEAARTLGVFNTSSATEALISALRDPSADVRVEATISLGHQKDSRGLAPLTSLLTDRDARVSLAAAESLARLQDPRATRVLIDSLSNPDWRVRSRATQVLARIAGEGSLDQAVTPLTAALADKDPVVRYYAAEALVGIGAKAVPVLIEAFRANRESDRDRAARVLWHIGAPAVDPLIAVLQDKNSTPEMRAASARTLGMIGDKRAIKALTLVLRDERYFVRQQAAFALGQMGDSAVVLLLEMAGSSAPSTREAAIEALGSTNSTRATDRVIEALTDPNANVRSAAARALGGTASDRAVQPLLQLLRDESSVLRGQAASSLARLGSLAIPGLISSLKDSRPSVRQLAASALGDIGSKEAVAPLIDLVNTDQSGARAEAIEALGKIGDPQAVTPILGVLRTGSVAVRKRAIGALGRFNDPRSIEALTTALSDQNEEVRQAAAVGLGDIGDERVVARLERLADNDSSSDVRTAAVQAIERIRQDRRPGLKSDPKPSRP